LTQVSVGSIDPSIPLPFMKPYDLTPVKRNTSGEYVAPVTPGEFLHGEHLALPADLNEDTGGPALPPLKMSPTKPPIVAIGLPPEGNEEPPMVPAIQFPARKFYPFTAIDSQSGGLRRDSKGGRTSSKSTSSMASPLLEEFRSTKTRDWTMRRIEGHVVEFCQDQNGSRFIQQRLEMGNVAEQQIVMMEVLPEIRPLRNDVFGNYVVQKLLDFGTPAMKADIRETLEGEMLQLSLQMYGCRVVQKAMEAVDEDDLPRLLREFHHNVLRCIHDQNGNHVIQKCIEVLNN